MEWNDIVRHGNSFKELLKYIKEKREYGSYNVYYQYKLDENAVSWKTGKRIYEYVYKYDVGKHIEDILFYRDYEGIALERRYMNCIPQVKDWDLYDMSRVQWAWVHYVVPEVYV